MGITDLPALSYPNRDHPWADIIVPTRGAPLAVPPLSGEDHEALAEAIGRATACAAITTSKGAALDRARAEYEAAADAHQEAWSAVVDLTSALCQRT